MLKPIFHSFFFVDDILILRVFSVVSLMVRFCGWLETAVCHLFVFFLLLSRCVNNNNNAEYVNNNNKVAAECVNNMSEEKMIY